MTTERTTQQVRANIKSFRVVGGTRDVDAEGRDGIGAGINVIDIDADGNDIGPRTVQVTNDEADAIAVFDTFIAAMEPLLVDK